MKKAGLKLVRGIGNLFRDLGRTNADIAQLKAQLEVGFMQAELHVETVGRFREPGPALCYRPKPPDWVRC